MWKDYTNSVCFSFHSTTLFFKPNYVDLCVCVLNAYFIYSFNILICFVFYEIPFVLLSRMIVLG